jgi:site-specific recombinase XerD
MSKIPGIFERPADSGIFWVSYLDADAKRHKEKAGKLPAALELLGRRQKEVKLGKYTPPRQERTWSFKRMAEETIKNKALRLAPASIETDEIRLGQLLPLIGTVPFDRVTTERIEATLAQLKSGGLSNSTLNRYRAFMSTVFNRAIATGRMSANPVSRVKRFPENDARVRWLRPEEEARIRKCLKVDYHRWEIDLALNTGMRRGEQFWLRWKDCDIERGILTVKGKTGRRHIVANEQGIGALKRLARYTREKEFVSPDNDGTATRDWRTWFEDACDEANVTDFHWHDLRHTFASRLVMAGVDIRTVQELLGHKSVVQTMKYAHLSADHRKAAVAKMNVEAAVPA